MMRLFEQFKKSCIPDAWYLYKQARNCYTTEVSIAKDNYENSKYESHIKESNSTKEWWKVVRSIQKSNEAFESIPPIIVGKDIITNGKKRLMLLMSFSLRLH